MALYSCRNVEKNINSGSFFGNGKKSDVSMFVLMLTWFSLSRHQFAGKEWVWNSPVVILRLEQTGGTRGTKIGVLSKDNLMKLNFRQWSPAVIRCCLSQQFLNIRVVETLLKVRRIMPTPIEALVLIDDGSS